MDQDNHESRENRRRALRTRQDDEQKALETRQRDEAAALATRDGNERLALLEQIGDLSRMSQTATDLFDERVGDFLGINRTDGRCLDIIGRLGRVSAGQLANESDLTTGAVTAVIDRLEAAGYVQRSRDPLDRRKIWVECTPHVNELVAIIFGVYDLLGPIMMRHFTAEQLTGILAFLRIGTKVNQQLAGVLSETTQPRAAPAAQLEQAQLFRRAMDALAPRLAAELEAMAPKPD
jgi:DNA-binding MarR family transcriptional regulator